MEMRICAPTRTTRPSVPMPVAKETLKNTAFTSVGQYGLNALSLLARKMFSVFPKSWYVGTISLSNPISTTCIPTQFDMYDCIVKKKLENTGLTLSSYMEIMTKSFSMEQKNNIAKVGEGRVVDSVEG